ncbi:MAG: glycosyltransferase family 4 protein [Nitrososphaeria archaeon]
MINLLMIGDYQGRNRRGGPGQIFTLITDELTKVTYSLKELRIYILNSKLPPELYEVRSGRMLKLPGYKLLSSIMYVIASSRSIYVSGNSIIASLCVLLSKIIGKTVCHHVHGLEIIEYKYEEKFLFRSLPYIANEILLLSTANLLLFPSRIYKEITYTIYPWIKAKSHVIPNGLSSEDLNLLATCSKTVKSSNYTGDCVLYVGRPTKIKGFHILVHLARIMLKRYPKLHILAVVEDSSKARSILLKNYRDMEIIKRMIFFERVDKRTLYALYKGALLTLIPSLFESFNMVALESILAGTPIVITNNCGIVDFLHLLTCRKCFYIAKNLKSLLQGFEFYYLSKFKCPSICVEILLKIFGAGKISLNLLYILINCNHK